MRECRTIRRSPGRRVTDRISCFGRDIARFRKGNHRIVQSVPHTNVLSLVY